MNKFAFLVIASLATLAIADDCLLRYCSKEKTACFSDEKCGKVLQCLGNCTNNPVARCPHDCGVDDENPKLYEFMQCQSNYGCTPKNKPVSGICYINEDRPVVATSQLVESLFGNPDQPKTFWYLKGLNCNQNATWFGGYDNLPCERSTYFSHKFIKFSFCYGENNECETDTYENWGALHATDHQDLFELDSWGVGVTHPMVTKVQVLSFPHPDWFMIANCNETPFIDVNRVSIVSTKRSYSKIPKDVEDEFKATAAKLGFSLDDMCEKDTTNCIEPLDISDS